MKGIRITLLFFVTLIAVEEILAKPFERNTFRNHDNMNRCEKNPDVSVTCQRCAKVTKSDIAYPMCCTDKEEAYRWCYKYINFGLQKRAFPMKFLHHDKDLQIEFLPPSDISSNMV